jgi:hypothetical protein
MELNGRAVVNVEIDNVDMRDYPDFCDAYFSYAEYADGVKLSDDELDQLTDLNREQLNEMALESIY